MTSSEQGRALIHDIQAVVRRYGEEFDVTYQQVIGALEVVKLDVFREMMEDDDE